MKEVSTMETVGKRKEGFSLASLLIGACTAPVWWVLVLLFNHAIPNAEPLPLLMIFPLIASLTGIVLGIIGLVKSLRETPRVKGGIVCSVIGIVLSVLTLIATALFWLLIYAVSAFA